MFDLYRKASSQIKVLKKFKPRLKKIRLGAIFFHSYHIQYKVCNIFINFMVDRAQEFIMLSHSKDPEHLFPPDLSYYMLGLITDDEFMTDPKKAALLKSNDPDILSQLPGPTSYSDELNFIKKHFEILNTFFAKEKSEIFFEKMKEAGKKRDSKWEDYSSDNTSS